MAVGIAEVRVSVRKRFRICRFVVAALPRAKASHNKGADGYHQKNENQCSFRIPKAPII
jgi:hypothetical protein